MKSFLVLGMGRLGKALATTLCKLGHEVMVVDAKKQVIAEVADFVTHAVIADCSDEAVLRSLGIPDFDHIIVAIGDDMQSSILITLMLKDLGAKYVISKAQNEIHAKVLERVGADRVILPEHDMGVRLANNLSSQNVIDYINLSQNHSIVEITVPAKWHYKSIKELNIRAKYHVNIITCKSNDNWDISPAPDYVFHPNDIIVVLGTDNDIEVIKKL